MSLEQFIQELTILTDKHKIVIDGCGCCGSPFLKVVETGEIIAERYPLWYMYFKCHMN